MYWHESGEYRTKESALLTALVLVWGTWTQTQVEHRSVGSIGRLLTCNNWHSTTPNWWAQNWYLKSLEVVGIFPEVFPTNWKLPRTDHPWYKCQLCIVSCRQSTVHCLQTFKCAFSTAFCLVATSLLMAIEYQSVCMPWTWAGLVSMAHVCHHVLFQKLECIVVASSAEASPPTVCKCLWSAGNRETNSLRSEAYGAFPLPLNLGFCTKLCFKLAWCTLIKHQKMPSSTAVYPYLQVFHLHVLTKLTPHSVNNPWNGCNSSWAQCKTTGGYTFSTTASSLPLRHWCPWTPKLTLYFYVGSHPAGT